MMFLPIAKCVRATMHDSRKVSWDVLGKYTLASFTAWSPILPDTNKDTCPEGQITGFLLTISGF